MSTANDRAAALALQSAKNFLACLAANREPGRKASKKALRHIRKAVQQHRRAAALLGV